MLTIMIHAKIKADRLNDYMEMIKFLTDSTSKVGCVKYSFNQNLQSPTEFVLYEQWESQEHLDRHINELFELLGPANPGEPIPHKLMELYESANPVYYEVIAQSASSA